MVTNDPVRNPASKLENNAKPKKDKKIYKEQQANKIIILNSGNKTHPNTSKYQPVVCNVLAILFFSNCSEKFMH